MERHRDDAGREPFVGLDPAAQRFVAALANPPYLHQLGPEDGRQALLETQGPAPVDGRTRTEFHAVEGGPAGLVGFWTVRPAARTGELACVLYVHGGRWMFGDAQTHARLIGELVLGTGACFVVPEYTRTPEARYPVAVEEIYAVLVWVDQHPVQLGLQPSDLAIAGDCVGATMAAAVTMMAKDRGGPRIRAQLLYYPFTDATCNSVSQREFGSGFGLSHDEVRWYWSQYSDDPQVLAEPLASPLRGRPADLAGLPPALVITAEADPVRDEGEAYARRLREAGVAVTAVRYLGTVHDFVAVQALERMPATRMAVSQGAGFLRDALDPRGL